jgi:hypothetical protein
MIFAVRTKEESMRSRTPTPLASVTGGIVILSAALLLSACEDEAEIDEVPEVAEVEAEPGRVEVEPGRVNIDLPDVELEEESLPFTDDDLGEMIMANGYVVGVPLANGFFLRTEGNHVIFVRSDQPMTGGGAVRVVGPLRKATHAVFDSWEADAFGTELEAEWKLVDIYYIDAVSIEDI